MSGCSDSSLLPPYSPERSRRRMTCGGRIPRCTLRAAYLIVLETLDMEINFYMLNHLRGALAEAP